MATVKSILDVVRKLVEILSTLRWVLERIERYEEKYKMSTEEFIRAWKSGALREPDDPETLSDFLNWEADYEMLERTLRVIRDLVGSS